MTDIKLSARLAAAAGYVRTHGVICDIGTDHALLPCYLWQKGARNIIASDINEGPLQSAKETVSRYIGDDCGIQLLISDGTENIPYADDVMICGMGGELIARIVLSCRFTAENTRFILQPMTKAELLRQSLYENGFEIMEEKAVFDGKLYAVMKVRRCGIKRNISPAFSYIGKIRDKGYADMQIKRLKKAAAGCRMSDPERAESLMKAADEIKNITENENEGQTGIQAAE